MSKSPSPGSAPPAPGGIKALAIRGSMYEVLSLVLQMGLRLGGNMVLTRLLFPEAFGLSALVSIFNMGLGMLSDVGIAPSVIQSKQGDDPEFLNSAWTLQAIRGVGLTAIGVLVAWPAALLYDEPQLGPLLAVGSLSGIITGLASTSLLTLRRRVDAKSTAQLRLLSQVIGLVAMIALALAFRSVWALIAGNLISSAALTIASHRLDVGYKNRFRYSKEAIATIVKFGRWIFFSSALTFVAQQTDRLMLGKLLGMEELGIYTVAVTFSEMGNNIVQRLTHQVLFPVFSKVNNSQPYRLREIYYKTRLALDAATLPAAGFGCLIAPFMIAVLYDDRYLEAGWMVQVLVLRFMFTAINIPTETCLFSSGASHFAFIKSALRTVWMLVALPIGYKLAGLEGLVWATALSEIPSTLVLLTAFGQRGMLRLHRELLSPVLFAAGAAIGFVVAQFLPT